jgi:hypothetical protein
LRLGRGFVGDATQGGDQARKTRLILPWAIFFSPYRASQPRDVFRSGGLERCAVGTCRRRRLLTETCRYFSILATCCENVSLGATCSNSRGWSVESPEPERAWVARRRKRALGRKRLGLGGAGATVAVFVWWRGFAEGFGGLYPPHHAGAAEFGERLVDHSVVIDSVG